MARSSEVNNTAFDIQVFISERAQDLAPEQSRQLLGQLQQLQRAFHLASGHAQAWADALSAQREREEERQRREKVKEEEKDRERQSAREREVWKKMNESDWSETLRCFSLIHFSLCFTALFVMLSYTRSEFVKHSRSIKSYQTHLRLENHDVNKLTFTTILLVLPLHIISNLYSLFHSLIAIHCCSCCKSLAT